MPELPEVETTLRGLAPLLHQPLVKVEVRAPKLRQPTPNANSIQGHTITALQRRAKYILAHLNDATTLLLHLGMSGRLTLGANPSPAKHDHILLHTPTTTVTFNDARRFGLFLHFPTAQIPTHPLLKDLGPEPLAPTFTGKTLHQSLQSRKTPIKPTLMDAKLVVGVGNIYASESLFRAQIHPQTPANTLTLKQCQTLVRHIQETLQDAITAGGSTLRDYTHSNGQLGYFQHQFNVYGRADKKGGQPCLICQTPIQHITQAQRSTFFCPTCQSTP